MPTHTCPLTPTPTRTYAHPHAANGHAFDAKPVSRDLALSRPHSASDGVPYTWWSRRRRLRTGKGQVEGPGHRGREPAMGPRKYGESVATVAGARTWVPAVGTGLDAASALERRRDRLSHNNAHRFLNGPSAARFVPQSSVPPASPAAVGTLQARSPANSSRRSERRAGPPTLHPKAFCGNASRTLARGLFYV